MNKIIDQILQNYYGQFNQVKKLIKKQTVQNHQFNIDQKFQIIDKVGRGSYSIVVAAICKNSECLKDKNKNQSSDENCKKIIAIKKLQNIFVHLTYTKKALRQLRAYRLLKHPNILQLHTIQLPPQKQKFHQIYCIFEMMDTNLQRVLQQSQQDLIQEHWKFLLYQILRALKYLHSSGVIHGNISTKACLVNEICDLKLSQLSQITLQSNTNRLKILNQDFSKLYYPAPQILLKDQHYTTAIDIWSAGCVFAQMINRKPFFQKNNFMLQIYCDYVGNPRQNSFKYLSQEGKSLIRRLRKHKRQAKDFKNLFPLLSSKGVDLMRKMLAFQCQDRISAKQALEHPYFAQLHSQECQPIRQQKQDLVLQFEYQNYQTLTTQEFKRLLFEEILLYHSSQLKHEYKNKVKRKQSLMNHILKKQQEISNQKGGKLNSYIEQLIDQGINKQQKWFHRSNLHLNHK